LSGAADLIEQVVSLPGGGFGSVGGLDSSMPIAPNMRPSN
jgi:hypothetical protein